MKKLLLLGICLCAGLLPGLAQTLTTDPANFTALDEVTITVDVRGTVLQGVEPLYVWTWGPTAQHTAGGNGQWTDSNEKMKMTKVSDNVWKWTITPTTFYGVAPSQIKKMEFLVKAKNGDGDKKTKDLALNVASTVFTESLFRTFPSNVTAADVVTLVFTPAYTPTAEQLAEESNDDKLKRERLQRITDVKVAVKVLDEGGATLGETTRAATRQPDGRYTCSLIPRSLLPAAAQAAAAKLVYTFSGTGKDAAGLNVPVAADPIEKPFSKAK